ncbi:MAG: hypothetical protein JWM42_3021 [Burkholderia sp.]|nr:hypothetical protein [Burkholderia sp.]
MSSQIDVICLIFLVLVVANVIGVTATVLRIKFIARRDERERAAITKAIGDYFRKSGVGVAVECARMPRTGRFTVGIESEPMKRFRLSHIIESTVREHVRKTCGLEVEKVYWRFPIKEAVQAATPGDSADEYINEGLEHYRHVPQPEVTELPWEHFEKMATISQDMQDMQQMKPAGTEKQHAA